MKFLPLFLLKKKEMQRGSSESEDNCFENPSSQIREKKRERRLATVRKQKSEVFKTCADVFNFSSVRELMSKVLSGRSRLLLDSSAALKSFFILSNGRTRRSMERL